MQRSSAAAFAADIVIANRARFVAGTDFFDKKKKNVATRGISPNRVVKKRYHPPRDRRNVGPTTEYAAVVDVHPVLASKLDKIIILKLGMSCDGKKNKKTRDFSSSTQFILVRMIYRMSTVHRLSAVWSTVQNA